MPPEEAGQPNRRYRIARLVVLPADGVIGVFDERIDVVDGQVDGALDGRGEGGEIGAFEHEGVERLFLRERGGGAHDFGSMSKSWRLPSMMVSQNSGLPSMPRMCTDSIGVAQLAKWAGVRA